MELNNRDDWWRVLNANWGDIKNILHRYLPMWEHKDLEGRDLVCPMHEYVESIRHRFADDLYLYLQAAWSNAPDDPSIHFNERWGIFCDLLSEGHLLQEDDQLLAMAEANMLDVEGDLWAAFNIERPDMRADWQKEGF